jgi:ribosomal protein L32
MGWHAVGSGGYANVCPVAAARMTAAQRRTLDRVRASEPMRTCPQCGRQFRSRFRTSLGCSTACNNLLRQRKDAP